MARPINFGLLFDRMAEQPVASQFHLDRPFAIAPDRGILYSTAALADLVAQTSGWIAAAGVRPGDRVAVIQDNHFDILLTSAAAIRMGAVPAQIAAANGPDALRALLARLQPALVVTSTDVVSRILKAGSDLLAGVRTVVLDSPGTPVDRTEWPVGAIALDDVRGAAPAPVHSIEHDVPMMMTHTSGTTGVPKIVVQSARTLVEASRLELLRLPFVVSKRKDTVLSSISFAHWRAVTWMVAQARFAPAKLVLVADNDPDRVGEVLRTHRPTSVEACPNVFQRWRSLTDTHAEELSQVRLYISTFDMVHPPTVRAFLNASRRRLPLWVASWGQSECGPISSAIFTRRRLRRTGVPVTNDVGWTVPTVARVRIVDQETGQRRGIGRARQGLMLASTKGRCLDYLGENDRHDRKRNGMWFNTGDVGYRDWLGRIRLVDREVDVIPGMSALELESTLLDRLRHATEVTVLGVPGRLPLPVLCLDRELDAAEWADAVRDLPPLDQPVVLPWAELPRTATWKVRRHALRASVLGTDETYGTGRWT
ncbi:class I adenylate-forming enzyme family protein [Nocardia cyriacigeorgica]|uniref:class I adenylate-forming enzyme family protein n=1 Tax=Nocardia cyriacigeorgica TaxID=135487 RepID=UPI001893B5DB|nr:class I adenylate-forming enzyme family protein [Nocardia cyriacigeorgica]MBF6436583.1 acyl--CoA ligase [Nocardia cyriacigeorgica]